MNHLKLAPCFLKSFTFIFSFVLNINIFLPPIKDSESVREINFHYHYWIIMVTSCIMIAKFPERLVCLLPSALHERYPCLHSWLIWWIFSAPVFLDLVVFVTFYTFYLFHLKNPLPFFLCQYSLISSILSSVPFMSSSSSYPHPFLFSNDNCESLFIYAAWISQWTYSLNKYLYRAPTMGPVFSWLLEIQ